jgi:hypothetical protein
MVSFTSQLTRSSFRGRSQLRLSPRRVINKLKSRRRWVSREYRESHSALCIGRSLSEFLFVNLKRKGIVRKDTYPRARRDWMRGGALDGGECKGLSGSCEWAMRPRHVLRCFMLNSRFNGLVKPPSPEETHKCSKSYTPIVKKTLCRHIDLKVLSPVPKRLELSKF